MPVQAAGVLVRCHSEVTESVTKSVTKSKTGACVVVFLQKKSGKKAHYEQQSGGNE